MTVIIEPDRVTADSLHTAAGSQATVLTSVDGLAAELKSGSVDVVVLGPSIDATQAMRTAEALRITQPAVGVVLVRTRLESGLLPEALRSGVRDIVEERNLASLADSIRRQHQIAEAIRSQSNDDATLGQVITVFSAKGGCGKTTVSTNLASMLAAEGHGRVAVVDLDLAFGDVAIVMQLFPTHSIADAVPMADGLDADGVRQLMTEHSSGVLALTAPISPDAKDTVGSELIGQLLTLLKHEYDYVIVDTSPSFDDQVLAAFDHSDQLVVLATPDIPALKNLKVSLDTLDLLGFPREKIKVVVNRADAQVGLSVTEVARTIKASVDGQLPSTRDVPASINRGDVLALTQPSHPFSRALRAFMQSSITQQGGAVEDDRSGSDNSPTRRYFFRRRTAAA